MEVHACVVLPAEHNDKKAVVVAERPGYRSTHSGWKAGNHITSTPQ